MTSRGGVRREDFVTTGCGDTGQLQRTSLCVAESREVVRETGSEVDCAAGGVL
jgi:hypothetical protein